MKLKLFALTGLTLAGLTAGAVAQEVDMSAVTATVTDNNAKKLGTIEVMPAPKGVLLHVNLADLPAGKHGFHIHQVGTCEDHENFKNSGGHIGKGENQHGFLNPQGYEAGDLPNLVVAENGRVEAEFFVHGLQLHGNADAQEGNVLLDADGSAFVIHENADDHKTQPIGGAGDRIACGALTSE